MPSWNKNENNIIYRQNWGSPPQNDYLRYCCSTLLKEIFRRAKAKNETRTSTYTKKQATTEPIVGDKCSVRLHAPQQPLPYSMLSSMKILPNKQKIPEQHERGADKTPQRKPTHIEHPLHSMSINVNMHTTR